jgi:uncharacterized protein (DUF2236 family)
MTQTEISGEYAVSRVLYRESAMILLAWPRAILLQLAHPLVAAGVADHSNFRQDPWRRFINTLDAALLLVYGTEDQARSAVSRIDRIHARVHGTLTQAVGRYPSGHPYDARDPELLLWVYATTIDSELRVFEQYLGVLTAEQRERYYQETGPSAVALGVPPEQMPATFVDLREWLRATLDSDIAIADFQRDLALSVLYPSLRFVPRFILVPLASIILGSLPPQVREGFGFSYRRSHRFYFNASRYLVRILHRLLPRRLRYLPLARARHLGVDPERLPV